MAPLAIPRVSQRDPAAEFTPTGRLAASAGAAIRPGEAGRAQLAAASLSLTTSA